MKKFWLVLLLVVLANTWGWCQLNTGIIDLAKVYRQFMFRNNPPESVMAGLDKYVGTELASTADFIRETVKPNSGVLSVKYLMRPSDQDLRLIYIVIRVNYNLASESPRDNNEVVDDLMKSEILTEDLVNNYYSTIFSAYGNKVKPFDLSNVDFQLNNYGLKDDTEKSIFFLASMQFNGMLIWGYINIAKPPRFEEAMKFIEKYPKYNGSPYFQFWDLSFPDFKIKTEWKGKPESYKAYYIDRYYDVLLNHLTCLKQMGADQEKIYDLVLGSILVNRNYYEYSKREKELKKLFSVYKK